MAKLEKDRKIISWTTLESEDILRIKTTRYAIGWAHHDHSRKGFLMDLKQTHVRIVNASYSCGKLATGKKVDYSKMICINKNCNGPQFFFVSTIFIEFLNINV